MPRNWTNRKVDCGQILAMAIPKPMARIRSAQNGHCRVVTVTGRLTAHDMRRLEHACAPALITAAPELAIDLRRVTFTDPTALAVLERMQARGAILKTRLPGPSAA